MRICFFGDSFVNGTGDDACLGWVGRLCAQARASGRDLTLYNLGIRRDSSADIAARWAAEARCRLPVGVEGRLVFSFGANDCADDGEGKRRLPASASLGHARAILGAAVATAPTLMVGPPPVGTEEADARIAALSVQLAELCGSLSIAYLPVIGPLSDCRSWRAEAAAGDGAHPNSGGYAALAALVAAWPAWQDWVGED
ncbi:GDSL-type esterase/lipase family protein [Marinibaculum pumilum]|uniref:GDSL-type esterase/lipase family protein n=1 Tax=Marinibaculum pumilum TaxID=1766165 RepID=A0ABV7L6E9_9PROT